MTAKAGMADANILLTFDCAIRRLNQHRASWTCDTSLAVQVPDSCAKSRSLYVSRFLAAEHNRVPQESVIPRAGLAGSGAGARRWVEFRRKPGISAPDRSPSTPVPLARSIFPQ